MGGWCSPVSPEGHFVVALQAAIARPSQHHSTLSYRDPERSLDAREETAGDWFVTVLKLTASQSALSPMGGEKEGKLVGYWSKTNIMPAMPGDRQRRPPSIACFWGGQKDGRRGEGARSATSVTP